MPPEQLRDLFETYERDNQRLTEQITDLCYFMKGGLEWNSAWNMSFEEREIMTKVINRRLKEENPNSKDYM